MARIPLFRRRSIALTGRALALAVMLAAAAGAQTPLPRAVVQARRACDGDTITAVRVRAHQPTYTGLVGAMRDRAAQLVHSQYEPTRSAVVAAYLRLEAGAICTERDRAESERVLRAQPFIASAVVQTIREGAGRTRIEVDVVDEVSLVVGARVSHGTLSGLTFGSENLQGRGLSLIGSVRRGFAYRDGFGFEGVKYGMFGRPDFLALQIERKPNIGERLSIELAEPFLTDLQRRAFHGRSTLESGYTSLIRPAGEDVSLFVRKTAYDAGWVRRIGRKSGRGAVGLFGLAVLGEDVRTGESLVVVTDTGLANEQANPFMSRYPAFNITRVAGIGGLRNLRFLTVEGFDALTAAQDVGVGVQLDFLAAPSVRTSGHQADVFLATDIYAGGGHARSFFTMRYLIEARADRSKRKWDGVVSNGRMSWYLQPSDVRTRMLTLEGSAVQDLDFPAQLSFRDADGGLAGFSQSTFAGGRRVIARAEERRLFGTFGSRADFAVGLFAAAGKLWAGDVPYGRTTGVHAAAGVSLLGAYPAGGKRTYRLDFAVPFNPETGKPRWEVRLMSSSRARLFWLEPNDVARARTGAVPVSLMKW
jgi:hypothetical protein